MTAKLELVEVSKSFRSKQVLKKLSLEVEDGEFLVILGPSGMGKSTLLRSIVGIEPVDGGKVLVDGEDVTNRPANKRNIAMVFQNYALYPTMSVYKNIAFPLKMAGYTRDKIDKKVREIAETLKITEALSQNVTTLSGGQKQRVALARALVRDPKLFLLDEPLSNLDARVRYAARQELKTLQRELGHTFVYVTHDQAEAQTLADRVAVLHNGNIEQIGTYEDLYEHPGTEWLGDFLGDYPMNFINGSLVGKDGYNVGFRTNWISEGKAGLKSEVELCQATDVGYFVSCTIDGKPIVVQTSRKYKIGAEVKFSLERFNLYKDGKLEEGTTE
ncbi:MAG: ABC transporter ATP-binding protein [Candidatus Thermoplasmatota archaeon]|jgi:ABC-type sugar transport system ATPase subunit|nr:ABC transporter ATP-binding protein [Candidatus Thermoplasmatota archaeon]MCL5955090.1 ABC transporter ATP-binding protein [Candidatus Thermoplasmatota archaeon]